MIARLALFLLETMRARYEHAWEDARYELLMEKKKNQTFTTYDVITALGDESLTSRLGEDTDRVDVLQLAVPEVRLRGGHL